MKSTISATIATTSSMAGEKRESTCEFQGSCEQEDFSFFQGLCVALPISLVMWGLIVAFAWMVF